LFVAAGLPHPQIPHSQIAGQLQAEPSLDQDSIVACTDRIGDEVFGPEGSLKRGSDAVAEGSFDSRWRRDGRLHNDFAALEHIVATERVVPSEEDSSAN